MESWIAVFLGLIALCSVIQVAFLCGLAVMALRTARMASELRQRATSELREPLAHLNEAARNVREITSIVSGETRAVQAAARQAAEQVREVKEDVRRVVRSPWVEISAFAKGVSRAVSTFRKSRPRGANTPAAPPTPSTEARPEPAFAPPEPVLMGERPWSRV